MVILHLRILDGKEEKLSYGAFPGFGEGFGESSYLLKLNFTSEEVGAGK